MRIFFKQCIVTLFNPQVANNALQRLDVIFLLEINDFFGFLSFFSLFCYFDS